MSFDEQPDGDIHGECAAEIYRLEREVSRTSAVLRMANDRWERACDIFQRACDIFQKAQDQLDACSPYLKEGEAVADALIRMQKEITTLRNAAMQQWADRGACDKEDAERYRWLLYHPKFAIYCFSYLPGQVSAEIDKSLAAQEAAG